MTIKGEKLGKRFGRNWIFRDVNINVSSGDSLAITGSNGSGKSTLLKILSGFLSPSEGIIQHNGRPLEVDTLSKINFSAPYVEIPEEMTFAEFLDFHGTFYKKSISNNVISERSSLPLNRLIADFSTGMKQRVQLSMSFYFEYNFIFMDEPTSNLDLDGFSWWKAEIEKIKCPLVIASNSDREIKMCKTSFMLQ